MIPMVVMFDAPCCECREGKPGPDRTEIITEIIPENIHTGKLSLQKQHCRAAWRCHRGRAAPGRVTLRWQGGNARPSQPPQDRGEPREHRGGHSGAETEG